MTSKVLTNEYKENINDGTIMTYGSLNEKECDIISINVRGKIKAIEKKKDYKEDSKQLKENTIKQVDNIFETFDWINSHYIFTCDFTEKGILYNKPFRFKYQVYVKPNERQPLGTYKDGIMDITNKINTIINNECSKVGFEIIK
jgi:hypothetical protein